MARVKVTVTTMQGEVLDIIEVFNDANSKDRRNEILLANHIMGHIENKFDFEYKS